MPTSIRLTAGDLRRRAYLLLTPMFSLELLRQLHPMEQHDKLHTFRWDDYRETKDESTPARFVSLTLNPDGTIHHLLSNIKP